MIINLFNKYQARFYFSQLEKRQGICSKKFNNDDKHMLLWDFDNEKLDSIIQELLRMMIKYELPSIYILRTSISGYHAYCFASRTFREIIHILSDTRFIDMHYLRLGMVRGYYTLRYSARRDGQPKLIKILASAFENEMSPLDTTVNAYYTTNRGIKK